MLRILVLSVIALSVRVKGGYFYPKPIISFELPNNNKPKLQEFGRQIAKETTTQDGPKTMAYSAPYEDYFYLKRNDNDGSGNNVFQSPQNTGNTINSEPQNLKISTIQYLTSLTPITTELNANIDASLSIQSSVVHSSNISESKSTNVQPILNEVNEPIYSLNSQKIVPSIKLQSTESQILNSQNDSDLLTLSNRIPSALNIENSNANLLTVRNTAAPVSNVRDSQVSIINVQGTAFPSPANGRNVQPPFFNVQHSDSMNGIQYNQLHLNINNGLLGNIQGVQETVSKLYTSPYSVQNSFSGNLYDKMNHFASKLHNEKLQLLEAQNNQQPLVYQSQFDSIYNNPNQIDNKKYTSKSMVTQHVYFHVPPPDMDELRVSVVRDTPTQKKIYKIIFITLPAQESRNKELQTGLYDNYNQLTHIEDKTLIYVLVNSTEQSQVLLPRHKLSQHEVLFVKYRDNPSFTANEENSQFIKTNSDDSDFAVTLGAGRVNGNR